jgi:GNAT superfamily N-acetyltransferase
MTKINIELDNPIITQKGVESITDFYETIAIDSLKLPGLSAFVTGVASRFLNVVIDTRADQHVTPEQVKTIAHFFKERRVPWVWLLTPVSTGDDLEKQGLVLLEEAPGMYFDLSQPLPEANMDFRIEEMDQTNNLTEWIQPLNEGFPSDDNGECYRKLNADLLKNGDKKLKHFIAYFDNEVAAAATLFLGKDAVMLHNLATKHDYQKRGLGKALALHRMTLAKQLGYKHCFLDASEEGFELHKRVGLQVYCITKAYALEKQ